MTAAIPQVPVPTATWHPNAYHDWVLEQMILIDKMPNMNTQNFIEQFNIHIKQPVINNPNMLYKNYWEGR